MVRTVKVASVEICILADDWRSKGRDLCEDWRTESSEEDDGDKTINEWFESR